MIWLYEEKIINILPSKNTFVLIKYFFIVGLSVRVPLEEKEFCC